VFAIGEDTLAGSALLVEVPREVRADLSDVGQHGTLAEAWHFSNAAVEPKAAPVHTRVAGLRHPNTNLGVLSADAHEGLWNELIPAIEAFVAIVDVEALLFFLPELDARPFARFTDQAHGALL
jgi:hypothetical protein